MGLATSRLKVGTWVANIYLRLPYLCAKSGAGCGCDRRPLHPRSRRQPSAGQSGARHRHAEPGGALRKYAIEVASWLRGEGPATHLPQQPSPYPVPIYLAALTSQNVELAGEIADGVMPLWWSVERVARSKRWVERGRAKSAGRGKLEMTLGLPTYVGDDIDALARRRPRQSGILHRCRSSSG